MRLNIEIKEIRKEVFLSFYICYPFLYVFQNISPQFLNFSVKAHGNLTIWAFWIQKSLNYLFLEDVHEKVIF
jgi:hypothetical protein